MRTDIVKEGKVVVKVPTENKYEAAVFYNQDAELQRDISVSVLQAWQTLTKKKLVICDALAATGVRGLRYSKEVSGIKEAILNDHNLLAVKLIKQNIKLNKLSKCKANWSETNKLLYSGKVFDFIDIDPFGTPAPFLDGAAHSIFHKGFVGITATDAAPLSGTYPTACLRKYGIKTIKGTEFYRELGLRNLLTFTILTFARQDRAFIPVLSHATTHYFRLYGKVEHAGSVEPLLKQIKTLYYCRKCLNREFGSVREKCQCGSTFETAGPIYVGPIFDREFCSAAIEDLKKRDFKQKLAELELLYTILNESDSPFYFDLDFLAKITKKHPPKMDIFLERLKSKGFVATRTHFCQTAIKTDAKAKQAIECL